MRSRRLVLAALVAIAPMGAAAQGRVVAEFPITLERNKTIIPVVVGQRTLQLILDTGMEGDGILVFHPSKLDTSAIPGLTHASIAGAGAGAASRALTSEQLEFRIGGQVFTQRVIILTGDGFAGFPTDGVIGHSLLGHYAVQVDHDRHVMTLYEPGSYKPEAGWATLPLYFKTNRVPWTDISIATGDEPAVRLTTYVDGASGESLELLMRDTNVFQIPDSTSERYLGRGLSGDIHGKVGRVAHVQLGPYRLSNVLTAFAPAEVRSKQDRADGIIGNGILSRFHVVFDYAHKALHLKPNARFGEPF